MDCSRSIFSPKVYGNGGPFEIADATADFRNSILLSGPRAVQEGLTTTKSSALSSTSGEIIY